MGVHVTAVTKDVQYDLRGQVVKETLTVPGSGAGTFLSQWGYTSAGAVAWMKYPGGNSGQAGEQVNYAYHPQGSLNTLRDSGSFYYVQSTTYDAAGRFDTRIFGSSVLKLDQDYYAWTTATGKGRLQSIKSGTPGSFPSNPSLQNLSYAYDTAGNITNIYDYKLGNPQTLAFHYDALDRLVDAQASGGTAGNFSIQYYNYDGATGNLSSKAGISYYYTAQSGSCPDGALDKAHAVVRAEGGSTNTYCYDPNGNMVKRTISGSAYTLSYDAENHLTSVTKTGFSAAFIYDADGNRVKGTVSGTTMTYVGNYAEWTSSGLNKYYYAGSTRVALRAPSYLKYLLNDHLSGTNIAANSDGSFSNSLRYYPWGETRYAGGTGSMPTTFRFTGQRSPS